MPAEEVARIKIRSIEKLGGQGLRGRLIPVDEGLKHIFVGPQYMMNSAPLPGGYYVAYADGTAGFVFE